MLVGIIALSFAKREQEPNPVNVRLAAITDDIVFTLKSTGIQPIVIAQHEVALALESNPDLVVTQASASNLDRNGNLYLSSQDVISASLEILRSRGVLKAIVVANPFLHLQLSKSLVRRSGIGIMNRQVPAVGFDNSSLNLQWWCKGPFRFIAYLALQAAGKVFKKNLHGIGEIRPRPTPH